ncbi:hypothetical protein MVEN_00570300 [Mycena venus]|uniref:F-box domain-containing protein n=1 Tax=Mycena venus TaxID=2733690 RepID=A0A8H6YQ03_9AGAR|nr:hypothetical protein MVEN_00570300 [Mycena venus]
MHRIDRIFYELVTLANDRHAEKFRQLIQSDSKPPGFFTVVKTLCLTYTVPGSTACGILAACKEVRSLACWVDNQSPQLPLLVSRLPLRRLSIELEHFSSIPVDPSSLWLSSLTHIDLVPWGDFPAQGLSKLRHFPRLTHVALNPARMSGTPEHIAIVCSSCPCLQVLILLRRRNSPDPGPQQEHDHRIVMLEEPNGRMEDWEASYFGHEDIWSRAEVIVAKQKAMSVGSE